MEKPNYSPKSPYNYPHYRVSWVYQGFSQDIPEMFDKPYALCKWWVREHKMDAQYCKGKFLILSLTHETVTS